MIANGNTHVLLAVVKSRLVTAVACQDVMILQHVNHNFGGCVGRQHFAEIVLDVGVGNKIG